MLVESVSTSAWTIQLYNVTHMNRSWNSDPTPVDKKAEREALAMVESVYFMNRSLTYLPLYPLCSLYTSGFDPPPPPPGQCLGFEGNPGARAGGGQLGWCVLAWPILLLYIIICAKQETKIQGSGAWLKLFWSFSQAICRS